MRVSISVSLGVGAVAGGAPDMRASARFPSASSRAFRARKRCCAVRPRRRSRLLRLARSSASSGGAAKRGSSSMQSTGQGGRHRPQPTHSSWMTVWVKLRAPIIASTGQAGRQRAQPTHAASSIRATEGCIRFEQPVPCRADKFASAWRAFGNGALPRAASGRACRARRLRPGTARRRANRLRRRPAPCPRTRRNAFCAA